MKMCLSLYSLLWTCNMFAGSVSSYQLGNTTYFSGTDANGNRISGDSMTLGNTTYTTVRDGNGNRWSGDSMNLGNTTYHTFRDNNGNRVSGDSMTLGNTTYHTLRDNNGNRISGDTTTLGNTSYTTFRDSNGNRSTASSTTFGAASYADSKRLAGQSANVESVADIERETQSIKDEIARLKKELEIEKESARQESVRQEKMRKSEAAKKREQALLLKEQEEAVAQDEDAEEEQPMRLSDRKPSSRLLCSSVVSSAHVRTITLENGRSFRVSLRDQFFIGGWVGDTVDVYSNFDKRGRYTGTVLKNVNKNTSMKVD